MSVRSTLRSVPMTAHRVLEADWWAPVAVLSLVFGIWLISLGSVDVEGLGDYGLVPELPLSMYVALVILTISFASGIYLRWTAGAMVAHVLLLVLIVHGTPAVVYETVRYSWAWKHVGIVDFIQRTGTVDPGVATLDAYHNWPGFFALGALVTQLGGFESAASFAAWAPVFFNVLNIGALVMIFRALSVDHRVIWLATWLFVLANWVGQDYFAPQALTFFMYLVVIAIVLGWFRKNQESPRWLPHPKDDHRRQLVPGSGGQAALALDSHGEEHHARLVVMVVAIAALGVIASSHQLTPLMAIIALGALAAFRTTERGLTTLAIVLTGTWSIYAALVFVKGNLDELGEVGGVITTSDSTLLDVSLASPGQTFVALMGRGLVAGLVLIAVAGGIRRLREGQWDLPAAILVTSPGLLLVANSYDGEILFRVYLFAVPFLALFAAFVFYPTPAHNRGWRTSAMVAVMTILMTVPFLFAYYGKEAQYYFSPDEVAAAEYLYATAPSGSLLVEGSRNYPAQFVNYEQYTYVPISREPAEGRAQMLADPAGKLEDWLSDRRYPGGYIIITRSQKAEIDALGTMPAGSLADIEKALLDSTQFTLLFDSEDARVFTLRARIEEQP